MKARVKATGEVIEIDADCSYVYAENYDKSYNLNELEFLDVKEDEPDYWEKLKHQYAGMFLAGMLANSEWEGTYETLSEIAIEIAEIHINRLKEEEK